MKGLASGWEKVVARAQRRGFTVYASLRLAAFSPWPLPFLFLPQSYHLKPLPFSEASSSALRAVTTAYPVGHGPWLLQHDVCSLLRCSTKAVSGSLAAGGPHPSPQDRFSLGRSGSGCSCPKHERSFPPCGTWVSW